MNIPCRNLIPKGELEKSVVQTQRKYKAIIFGNYSKICIGCIKEPWDQGKIDRYMYQERLKGIKYKICQSFQFNQGR